MIPTQTPQNSTRTLWIGALVLWTALAAVRFWFSTQLSLFGDEAFYWLESQHPAAGYSDVPLLTPLLVRIGTWFAGNIPTGVRWPFNLVGMAIPFAVWWLARPLTGPRQALTSFLAAMALPLLAGLGLLALPDVPLALLCTLTLGMAVRVIRQPSLSRWLGLGLLMALGFLAHYRFVMIPLALLIASLSGQDTRRLWRSPGPWLATGLAVLGLLPALWFNLQNSYAAVAFHFLRRHPWTFQPAGLSFPILQALVTTPLMFLALLAAFRPLANRTRQGDPAARLLLVCSGLYLGLFGGLSPWTDQQSTSVHWPLDGYIPLLVFLPAVFGSLGQRYGLRAGKAVAALVLGSGWLAVAIGMLWCHGMTRLDSLPHPLALRITANMAGWPAIAERVTRENTGHLPVITDNYYLSTQLAFETGQADGLYTFDDDKSHRDGRERQLVIWGALLPAGSPWPDRAFAALESSRHTAQQWQAIVKNLCQRYPGLASHGTLDQFQGRRQVVMLQLQVPGPQDPFCDTALAGWTDHLPAPEQDLVGMAVFDGWYSHPLGVRSIILSVDGQAVATADYGQERQDVAEQLSNGDPALAHIGFRLAWDSRTAADGWHRLQLVVSTRSGIHKVVQDFWVRVSNHGR